MAKNRLYIAIPMMLVLISLRRTIQASAFCPPRAFSRISHPNAKRQHAYYSSTRRHIQFQPISAPHAPSGDQPQAIQSLLRNCQRGDKYSVLRGITGTGKTLVMAHTIARLGKPALVLCHNKTLAGQLARELRSFLGKERVQLFVSYYNYYFPESYNETNDKYKAKKSSINDDLDALRHIATRAICSQNNAVIVASVSCIYGLGMPKEYLDGSLNWVVGEPMVFREDMSCEACENENELMEEIRGLMKDLAYGDNAANTVSFDHISDRVHDLLRGEFELSKMEKGGVKLVLHQPSSKYPTAIRFEPPPNNRGGYIISSIHEGTSTGMRETNELTLFPAKHHVTGSGERFQEALRRIQEELLHRVEELRAESKNLEADRLLQRVGQDLMLLKETGTCPGVENYSRHFTLREAGEAPDTLLDYFYCKHKSSWLLFVDESHVALPQLRAMYAGDRSRKERLVKHGFRLPSALDNRPLTAHEFWERVPQAIFVSATPSKEELRLIPNTPIDMIIRPTFVCDPIIHVRPRHNQLKDLVTSIQERMENGERSLALALTKRDAEDLSEYLKDNGVNSSFIHSGLNALERADKIKALQRGDIECLVGVNLLREGLDLPEVSLVAVLSADSEGFLRSESALLQIIGRAARNKKGTAVLYANRITKSMQRCIDVTNDRRQRQILFNAQNNRDMRSTTGSTFLSIFDLMKDEISEEQGIELFSETRKSSDETKKSDLTEKSITPSRNDAFETDHIPSKPGVYFWRDNNGTALYIGKAKRLRSRVKSYLAPNAKHSSRIKVMLQKAATVDFIITPTETDALLLESNLIKRHQPAYNVLMKDDTTYPYICASIGHNFPQFSIVQNRDNSSHKYFGPYTDHSLINKILLAVEEKYNLRKLQFEARLGSATRASYVKVFEKALDEVFVQGDAILNDISPAQQYSGLFDPSENGSLDIVTIKYFEEGSCCVVSVMQLRSGLVAGQFSYNCAVGFDVDESAKDDMIGDAIEFTLQHRHYPSGASADFFPTEMLVQYPVANKNGIRKTVRDSRKLVDSSQKTFRIEIRTAGSGRRREEDEKAILFAIQNAKSGVSDLKPIVNPYQERKNKAALVDLAKMLSLKNAPSRIECYDISHTQGDYTVGSRVVFIDGSPAKHLYRQFNIKHQSNDDYASIEEVLQRRFKRARVNGNGALVHESDPWSVPDLVVVDGGKGQLHAALKGMALANVCPNAELDHENVLAAKKNIAKENVQQVPVIAIAKKMEEVFIVHKSGPINNRPDSPALLLLRALRDESHRFALKNHRRRRSKENGFVRNIKMSNNTTEVN